MNIALNSTSKPSPRVFDIYLPVSLKIWQRQIVTLSSGFLSLHCNFKMPANINYIKQKQKHKKTKMDLYLKSDLQRQWEDLENDSLLYFFPPFSLQLLKKKLFKKFLIKTMFLLTQNTRISILEEIVTINPRSQNGSYLKQHVYTVTHTQIHTHRHTQIQHTVAYNASIIQLGLALKINYILKFAQKLQLKIDYVQVLFINSS